MPVRSKAQAAGLAEFGELVWREDADEAAVQGIVFSNRRNGVRHAEWTLAGNYNVAVGRDRKIERAEFRIRHQPGRLGRSRGSERYDGVVALAIRADAGGQEQPAVMTERKSAGKWHYPGREDILAGRAKPDRKGHDRTRAARADIITAVRPKIAAAGVQPFNRAAVTNDPPIRVERQHPVGAAVEKEQPFVPIDGKAAWIGNAAVTAEGTERPAIGVESMFGFRWPLPERRPATP